MKKVTMFLWNHFTNDARVLREGNTLSENGYDINLIAIEKANDKAIPKFEEINKNFKVNRVRMYPITLMKYQSNKRKTSIGVVLGFLIFGPLTYVKSKKLFTFLSSLLLGMIFFVKNKFVRRNMIKFIRSYRMILKGYSYNSDIYHSHDLNTLTQGVICSKMRIKKKKLIYDSHEIQTDRTGYNPKIIKVWERALLRFVDQTIVENETRAEVHEKLYGYQPKSLYNYSEYYEIKNKPDINLKKILNLNNNDKILLYQGGIQPGRGLEILVRMMKFVEGGTLVFIGDGRQKPELIELVNSGNLSDKVKFVDKVPLDDLPSYTKQAYLGFQVLQNVNLNHYTASSNKLFEYIMANVPVISCDFPEIKKIVDNEKIGLSIDASNEQKIASAVNKLIIDVDQRNYFSDNCEKAKIKYNWNNEEKKLLDIYNNL